MNLKGLTPLLLVAVGAGVAWYLLGKPSSLGEVQTKISGLLHGGAKANYAGRGFGGGPSHFSGGWAGAVGNPGFVHGHDLPFAGNFFHPHFEGFHRDFDRGFHGFPYLPGVYPPGVFGAGYGYPAFPHYPHFHGFRDHDRFRGFHHHF